MGLNVSWAEQTHTYIHASECIIHIALPTVVWPQLAEGNVWVWNVCVLAWGFWLCLLDTWQVQMFWFRLCIAHQKLHACATLGPLPTQTPNRTHSAICHARVPMHYGLAVCVLWCHNKLIRRTTIWLPSNVVKTFWPTLRDLIHDFSYRCVLLLLLLWFLFKIFSRCATAPLILF